MFSVSAAFPSPIIRCHPESVPRYRFASPIRAIDLVKLVSTVSRPPEPRARRVLTSSTTSTNNLRSPPLASSKPIRARVDLSSLASPPTSPSLHAANPAWTPTQPVRVKAKSTVGVRSAPTTPTVQSIGQFRSTPTNGYIRATLSPQTAAGGGTTTPGGGTRATSPHQRARSPDVANARARTTSKLGQSGTAAGDLRGQQDPFPSSSSNNPSTTTPITHLPSSVSVRKLHSPSLRASQRQERDQQQYLSTSTSTNASTYSSTSSSSAVSPLSTSPSSIASSPLTSPNLHSLYDSSSSSTLSPRLAQSTTGLGFYDHAPPSHSLGRKSGSSSNSDYHHRTSQGSSIESSSSSLGGLLPAYPTYSSPSPSHSPFPISSPLPHSPSFSNVTPNPLRSPTLPSSSSTRTLRSVPVSNPSTHQRPPIRTRTITSSSSEATTSIPFPSSDGSLNGTATVSTSFATLGTTTTSTSTRDTPVARTRVDQMDWNVRDDLEEREEEANLATTRGSSESRIGGEPGLLSSSPTTTSTSASHGMESLLRESIEKEIEAKVSRRVSTFLSPCSLSTLVSLETRKIRKAKGVAFFEKNPDHGPRD